MSWIREHWDPEYILNAEQAVKEIVSCSNFVCHTTHIFNVLDG
jgi:hypothetical protein